MTDWRIENAKHTFGATLQLKKYTRYSESWDHDHCEACWAKFMESAGPQIAAEGYATEDNYRWICADCFVALKVAMGWKLR
jgi:hypothetical protein